MNAIEIKGLKKSFRGMYALNGLNMTVPVGSIYGFIGENGSGKSTTEKLICGHLVKDCGSIKLFGKDYTDAGTRIKVGALIENAGCFPGSSIYMNLKMQCLNLGLNNADEEIDRVLKIVRMEEHKCLKVKKCSLGMKQRVGIAMALLGSPSLLILDEPINGLDTDGMSLEATIENVELDTPISMQFKKAGRYVIELEFTTSQSELAQIKIPLKINKMEACTFVAKGTNGALGTVKANVSIMQWEQNLVFSSENEVKINKVKFYI
jgi:ABC-2 type transport system ATP-binding protein